MLIDWFTVGAQALNFLILIWLMKRFLYKPILNAIDAREARIAGELADAASRKQEADKERDDLRDKNKAFDDERGAMLGKAADEAKAEREQLMGDARKDGDALRDAQDTALRNDQTRVVKQISRLAKDEVFGIARKALTDLATVSLEERLGEVFTRRLRDLSGTAKATLATAFGKPSEEAVVKSTFDLPAAQKAAIQNALNETFSMVVRVRFETSPAAVCGIELTANGQKVGWSIGEYLDSLEQKAGALMNSETVSAPLKQSKPETTPTLETAAVAGAR